MLGAFDHEGNLKVHSAYYYAVSERMFPYFHEHWCSGDDPFEDVYRIKKEFIEDVVTYVNKLWIDQEPIPTFYDLEKKYGRENRSELINIFRYCYLNGGFDEAFYRSLLEPMQHPTEASGLCRNLDSHDFLLV